MTRGQLICQVIFGMVITEIIFIGMLRLAREESAFFVKKCILELFDVIIEDKTYEGILWLRL